MEKIIKAAILFPTVYISGMMVPQIILTGIRHCDCFEAAHKLGLRYNKDEAVQGFWTDQNRFLNRYDAMDLALATGQLSAPTNLRELFSEDLW